MSLPEPPAPAAVVVPRRRLRPSPVLLAAIAGPLYALDQWTKFLVVRRIAPGGGLTMIPDWFWLVFTTNRGAAWGMFQNASAFFLALAAAALVVLAVLWRRGVFAGGKWSAAGLCLLAPGILGNLTDRIARGFVVDFLSFDLHFPGAHPFPVFNVADSCICVAVGCLLIGSFFEEGGRQKAKGRG